MTVVITKKTAHGFSTLGIDKENLLNKIKFPPFSNVSTIHPDEPANVVLPRVPIDASNAY
jgi:hypothetical protein